MYTSQHFGEPDEAEIARLIQFHALGLLVSRGPRGFNATHAPMLLEPGSGLHALLGHLARPNPHWRQLDSMQDVLVVFRGPDSYVTPSVYVAEPDVPTWNYSAVHVHGRWELLTAERDVRRVLDLSVAAYEAARGSGWDMSLISVDLATSLQRGVVAFRVHVDRIEAAQKLSQDKCLEDVRAVVGALSGCPFGGDDTARAMERVTVSQSRYRPAPANPPSGRE